MEAKEKVHYYFPTLTASWISSPRTTLPKYKHVLPAFPQAPLVFCNMHRHTYTPLVRVTSSVEIQRRGNNLAPTALLASVSKWTGHIILQTQGLGNTYSGESDHRWSNLQNTQNIFTCILYNNNHNHCCLHSILSVLFYQ